MKTLALWGILSSGLSLAQEQGIERNSTRMNDVMISPIEMITNTLLNISYERLLNSNSGVGLNALVQLSNEGGTGSQISPYYRQYFGRNFASGFFVEGFVPITTTKVQYETSSGYWSAPNRESSKTTVGLGIGLGGKWITRSNIMFEAGFGVARRFGDLKENTSYSGNNSMIYVYEEHPRLTGKFSLGIGYRF